MVLSDYSLKLRRKHRPIGDRAAILRDLEQADCTFTGQVEEHHRRLAHELEKLDVEVGA